MPEYVIWKNMKLIFTFIEIKKSNYGKMLIKREEPFILRNIIYDNIIVSKYLIVTFYMPRVCLITSVSK